MGFGQGADLTDGVGSGPGDYQVGQGKEVRQFFADVFVLYVAFGAFQGGIQFVLSAEMDYLEVLQEFREDLADGVVDDHRAQASADHQDDGLIGCEVAELQRFQLVSPASVPGGWGCR